MSIKIKLPKWARDALRKLSGKLIATILVFLIATFTLMQFLITSFDKMLNNPNLTLAIVTFALLVVLAMFKIAIDAIMGEKKG